MNNGQANKVGAITFHRAINYGAVLQAYALQEAVKKLGFQYELIDYRNSVLERVHKERRLSDCKSPKAILKHLLYASIYNRKHKKFREFLDDYLSISTPCFTSEDLRKLSSRYTKVITGSDQVFNCNITGFDKAYFLDFIEEREKKTSYAASFGFSTVPGEFIEEYKQLLADFSYLTVRERDGAKIVIELLGKEPEVVLDPVMLLSKEEWASIAKEHTKKKNYILLYAFKGSKRLHSFVENLSKQTGCEIVYISFSLVRKLNAVYEKCVGPTEFLGLFKNARYVVTNSFHGTAFSINFNKDFFMELLPEEQKVNSRLTNILNVFNLRSRQIVDGENAYIDQPVNYEEVNKILKQEREKSLNCLQDILGKGCGRVEGMNQ